MLVQFLVRLKNVLKFKINYYLKCLRNNIQNQLVRFLLKAFEI